MKKNLKDKKSLNIAMLGHKRIPSREGGIEIVVEELATRMVQLGMYEKEEWLYRLMMGKTLVFPNELKKRKTTLTYAADVAVAISELIENESAYGEIFHITTTESLSWEDAFEKYTSILSETTGKQFHIKYVDDIEMFYNIWNVMDGKYQEHLY